jgi:hypothetical protein
MNCSSGTASYSLRTAMLYSTYLWVRTAGQRGSGVVKMTAWEAALYPQSELDMLRPSSTSRSKSSQAGLPGEVVLCQQRGLGVLHMRS